MSWMNTCLRHKGEFAKILITSVIVIGIPIMSGMYMVRVATDILLYASLAQCWNMIGGLAGYPSFGLAGFFGLGSYGAAILISVFKWSVPLALLAGGTISLGISAILWPVLRLKTHYFAIATYGIAEVLREIVSNLEITRGGKGMSLPILYPDIKMAAFSSYFAVAVVFLVTMFICLIWLKTKTGGALLAIREDEDTAESVGIDTRYYKCVAFSTSAFITGVAGGIYAYWIGYIDPQTTFTPMITIESIVIVLLGGAGTLWGPVVGATTLGVIREVFWGSYPEIHGGLVGALIIIIILFMPAGLSKVGLVKKRLTVSAFFKNAKRYGI